MVEAIKSGEPEVRRQAFGALVGSYWKPVYKYLRLRWRIDPDDAQDLTQEFFSRAYEKEMLEQYDPDRARFRTFLRVCVDRMVQNHHKAVGRLKRGGKASFFSLDFAEVEKELLRSESPDVADLDQMFQAEWVRSLFELAIDRARAESVLQGRELAFAVFERYDIQAVNRGEVVTYAQVAREFGIPPTQVTNHLAFARRRLRHHLLAALRETTASEAEFRVEVREVLGL